MKRRRFFKLGFLTALGINLGLTSEVAYALEKQTKKAQKKIIKPKRLSKGSRIGIIAPASFITEEDYKTIENNLKLLDLIPVPSKNLFEKFGYLAGKDDKRVDDIHEMFSRKDIDGILCARGGYGTPRLLKLIDYNLIKRNPKVFIGYSDITALLVGIHIKTGLVTFHGPVGISTFNEFTVKYFRDLLIDVRTKLELISEPDESNSNNSSIQGILKINSGKTQGQLIGGNLSLLETLFCTEFDFDLDGKILFLEEINEEPYRIDRILTHFINANKLRRCKGIAIGVFSNCEVKKENPAFIESLNLYEVLVDKFSKVKMPVIYGLSFGHIKNKFTLPIGIKAELDVDQEKIILLESAVI